eukprot:1183138-Prorocentrum_minimum.AAC.1
MEVSLFCTGSPLLATSSSTGGRLKLNVVTNASAMPTRVSAELASMDTAPDWTIWAAQGVKRGSGGGQEEVRRGSGLRRGSASMDTAPVWTIWAAQGFRRGSGG